MNVHHQSMTHFQTVNSSWLSKQAGKISHKLIQIIFSLRCWLEKMKPHCDPIKKNSPGSYKWPKASCGFTKIAHRETVVFASMLVQSIVVKHHLGKQLYINIKVLNHD